MLAKNPYHLISARQLTPKVVKEYLDKAEHYEKVLKTAGDKKNNLNILNGVIVASVFFEESTRTRFSFEAAAQRLGAKVISTENAAVFSASAEKKGESLEHTIKVISNPNNPHLRYADIIVLRHPEKGAAERAANVSGVPIINAGDGDNEHPSQALLDAYTFQKLMGRLSRFNIAFTGDLKYSRVIDSNAILLAQYPRVKMFFVSPRGLEIKNNLKFSLRQKGVEFKETNNLKKVAHLSDIVYIVRVQKNRIKDKKLLKIYQKEKNNFAVTKEIYKMTKQKGTFFCHPMPIDKTEQEIKPEIENLSRVKMISQAGNGIPVRMAILAKAWNLQKEKDKQKNA